MERATATRAHVAAAFDDPAVAGAEEGVGPCGGDRCFAEGAAEPGVALAGGAGGVLVSGLEGAWGECPALLLTPTAFASFIARL